MGACCCCCCKPSEYQKRFGAAQAPCARTTQALGITHAEQKKFFAHFDKMDLDKSGELGLYEFLDGFGNGEGWFMKRLFGVMNETVGDAAGDVMTYSEFVIGLWNVCSVPPRGLCRVAFDLADVNGSGYLDKNEIGALIHRCIGGGQKKEERRTDAIVDLLDTDHNGKVSATEFERQHAKMEALFRPAFSIQLLLQDRFMGLEYWEKARERRREALEATGRAGGDLFQLHYEIYHRGSSAKGRAGHTNTISPAKVGPAPELSTPAGYKEAAW